MPRPAPIASRAALALTLGLCAAAAAQDASSAAHRLREEDAYLRAVVRRSLAVRAESLSVQSGQADSRGAASLLLPQVRLRAASEVESDFEGRSRRALRGDAMVSQLLPGGGSAQASLSGSAVAVELPAPVSRSIREDSARVTISVEQPLLRGFAAGAPTFHGARAAVLQEEIQVAAGRGEVLAILAEARRRWWEQAAAEAVVSALVHDTLRTGRLLLVARIRATTGSAAPTDTLQARIEHLRARLALREALDRVADGARRLGNLADTAEIRLGLAGDTLAFPPEIDEPAWPTIDTLVALADSMAPELARAALLVERAELEAGFRRRDRLPDLRVGAAGESPVPGGNPTRNWIWSATVQGEASIPSGIERARYRRALLDLRRAGLAREAARREVRLQLAAQLDRVRLLAERSRRSREILALQAALLRAAETAYAAGAMGWIELAQVRRDHLDAMAEGWSLLAAARVAEFEIDALAGTGLARLGWEWRPR